ncbi:hypothetical protein EBR21_15000, partial [bacterium]|nr:hypothetical protein [bacterium]
MNVQRSACQKRKRRQSLPFAFATLGLLASVGCSGRVVTSNNRSAGIGGVQTFSNSQAAEANSEKSSGLRAISLVSPPASETFLESFSSAVDAPGATHYRASVVDGKDASCANLTVFNKVSDVLTLQLGKPGDKTICLQPVSEAGGFGSISSLSIKKKEPSGDGPELILEGAPQWITTSSNTSMSVVSQDAVQYRYSFTWVASPTAQCKTLENFPWKSVGESLSLKYEYDGPWLLCVEVRDRNGRKSLAPKAYSWSRDTVYPVMNPLPLPGMPTTESDFSFDIKGNL